jgi:hypothetical protein
MGIGCHEQRSMCMHDGTWGTCKKGRRKEVSVMMDTFLSCDRIFELLAIGSDDGNA